MDLSEDPGKRLQPFRQDALADLVDAALASHAEGSVRIGQAAASVRIRRAFGCYDAVRAGFMKK